MNHMADAIKSLRDHVDNLRLEEIYSDELAIVMKSVPGLSEQGKRILKKVYLKSRRDGVQKEKCEIISRTAVVSLEGKEKLQRVYKDFSGWTQTLKLKKSYDDIQNIVQKVKTGLAPIDEARSMPTINYISSLEFPVYCMSFPCNVSNESQNNKWMDQEKNQKPYNYDRAYKQWLDLYSVVGSGSLVYLMPSEEGLQDEVYTANSGLALPSNVSKNTIILSNFRSKPRQGEEGAGRQFFGHLQYNVVQPPAFFEGEADIKYVRDNVFIAGYGIRSQIEAYNWMQEQFDMEIVKIKMTDQLLYHFDCLLFPINNENVLVGVKAISPEDLKSIEAVVNVIPIPDDLLYTGITNCVRVGNIIINSSDIMETDKADPSYPQEVKKVNFINETAAKFGLDPVLVNINEFEKSGADTSCMVMHLNYFDYVKQSQNQTAEKA